jgi:hypothetical protein
MHATSRSTLAALCVLTLGCTATRGASPAQVHDAREATLAQIYFWRARPGMAAEYSRYIREVAEPIDEEARRAGAFVSVTTYEASDSTVPWTHMRVFLLRDSVQLGGLGAALTAAGARIQPDSIRRQRTAEYSASLRDRVGATVTRIVR